MAPCINNSTTCMYINCIVIHLLTFVYFTRKFCVGALNKVVHRLTSVVDASPFFDAKSCLVASINFCILALHSFLVHSL